METSHARHDYTAEVFGGWAKAAHYYFDHREFGGLVSLRVEVFFHEELIIVLDRVRCWYGSTFGQSTSVLVRAATCDREGAALPDFSASGITITYWSRDSSVSTIGMMLESAGSARLQL
jgi:hypothetical protein